MLPLFLFAFPVSFPADSSFPDVIIFGAMPSQRPQWIPFAKHPCQLPYTRTHTHTHARTQTQTHYHTSHCHHHTITHGRYKLASATTSADESGTVNLAPVRRLLAATTAAGRAFPSTDLVARHQLTSHIFIRRGGFSFDCPPPPVPRRRRARGEGGGGRVLPSRLSLSRQPSLVCASTLAIGFPSTLE
jgi:hypothetical protein